MNLLEFLNNTQQSNELRQTVSIATFLWSISSIIAVLLRQFGWIAGYEEALPYVILVTWLGSEIVARIPNRNPIAVCEKCEHMQILPRAPLRRYWPWKRCTRCGGRLMYCCINKHLLSLFPTEDISPTEQRIWCSRCGEPLGVLSADMYQTYLSQLVSQKPLEIDKEFLINTVWKLVKGTELEDDLKQPLQDALLEYLRPKSVGLSRMFLD